MSEPNTTETCLWVQDATGKALTHYGVLSFDPESFRCTPNGHVFCKPCLTEFKENTP